MKKEFSTNWKGSKQPRKQRKYLANAPLHIKRKLMSAPLSKDLRKKYSKKNTSVRKNDSVKVITGEFKGKTGKISVIDTRKMKVNVEGLNITKKDGSKANVWFDCSNLIITELSLDDKMRIEALNRKEAKK
jgi:large subunit ribosomal protein L24